MKVGDYCRNDIGRIFQVTGADIEYAIELGSDGELPFYYKKTSPNIIDLIEVGDYVNGLPVYEDKDRVKFVQNYDGKAVNINMIFIESILTKEQFEQMEYKL